MTDLPQDLSASQIKWLKRLLSRLRIGGKPLDRDLLAQALETALDVNHEAADAPDGRPQHPMDAALPKPRDFYNREQIPGIVEATSRFFDLYKNVIESFMGGHYPSEADVQKSALFHRLLAGKEPLPLPPPTAFSYPWYAIVEDEGPFQCHVWENPTLGPKLTSEIDEGGLPRISINQTLWVVVGQFDGRTLVRYRDTDLLCWLLPAVEEPEEEAPAPVPTEGMPVVAETIYIAGQAVPAVRALYKQPPSPTIFRVPTARTYRFTDDGAFPELTVVFFSSRAFDEDGVGRLIHRWVDGQKDMRVVESGGHLTPTKVHFDTPQACARFMQAWDNRNSYTFGG